MRDENGRGRRRTKEKDKYRDQVPHPGWHRPGSTATAAVIQPWAGRAHDVGRLGTRLGLGAGLAAGAAGLALAAFVPGLPGLLSAAIMIGVGTALITPLGFAVLAASAPEGQLGQTMGAAEVGREIGDAGGPLLVGLIAAATLTGGLAALAVLLAIGAGITASASRDAPEDAGLP